MQVELGCGGGASQVLVVVAIFGVTVAYFRHAFRARTEALTALGRQLGLRYAAFLDDPPAPPSLSAGRPKVRGAFVLEGRLDGRDVAAFSYTTGSGKSARTQTVVTLRAEGRPLPSFLLTQETFVDKLAATMGGQDLDFDGDSDFSQAFRLRGDEGAVRQLFGPGSRARLRNLPLPPRLHVEGWGDRLSIWVPGAVVKPEQLQDRLKLAAEIASAVGR
jgi:hypothetical protein